MTLIPVIDLGEVSTAYRLDDQPARPHTRRRRLDAAVALGLALVTPAASAPVPRPLPMAVLAAPAGSSVTLEGDRLFVVEPDRSGIHRHVAAYRLRDLDLLWRVELSPGGEVYGVTAVDGTLVLTAMQENAGPLPPPSTVGLDVATGAVRWRYLGVVDGSTPGGRLVLSSQHVGPGGAPTDARPGTVGQTLLAVQADTGDLAWSFDLPPGATWSHRSAGENLALLAVTLPDGEAELRDAESGKLLRSRQIGRQPQPGSVDRFAQIVGNLLLVPDGSWTAAYGLDRLDLRWRLAFEIGRDGWPVPCGDGVCFLRDGGGLTVIDQATGHHKWSDSRWSNVLATVDGYLVASGSWRDDQIVVAVDWDTGRVRRELGSWQEVPSPSIGDPLIGIRYEVDRTLVARLDPARGTEVLGVLHASLDSSCWRQASRLLCWRAGNTLGMWRLPE